VWRARPEVLLALDRQLGEPTDAYVNGSQTWLRDDGPGGEAIEWRLHPVAGFHRPDQVGVHELFELVVYGLATGGDLPAPLGELWDGLEAFPAHGDDVEPAPLAAALGDVLGIAPDAFGLVDHEVIADGWEAARGALSVVDALLDQLRDPPPRSVG
jgi:hypothetical protein